MISFQVIHESGVPPIHTPISILNSFPEEIKKKLLIVHCSNIPETGLKNFLSTGAKTLFNFFLFYFFSILVEQKMSDGSSVQVPVTHLHIPPCGIQNTISVDLGSFNEGKSSILRKLKILSDSPFFRKLSPTIIYQIMTCLEEQTVQPDEEIVVFGEKSENFFFIEYGTVIILSQDRRYISTLTRGDVFGENSLRSKGHKCTATIVSK